MPPSGRQRATHGPQWTAALPPWRRTEPTAESLADASCNWALRAMTKSALLTARSAVWLDSAGAAVHGDPLPFPQSGGGVPGGDHGGDAVLAGDQGGVGGQGAAVGDDRDGAGEQWRPGRGGGSGDQDLAGLEAVEVARS